MASSQEDLQIEELQKTIKTLKKELLDLHDWIADYIAKEKNMLFALQKLQARILAAVRVPARDVS